MRNNKATQHQKKDEKPSPKKEQSQSFPHEKGESSDQNKKMKDDYTKGTPQRTNPVGK